MADQDQRRRMSNEVLGILEQRAYRIKTLVYTLQPLGCLVQAAL